MYCMKLLITSVDENLFLGEVEKLSVPTLNGVFGILPNHTNMIAVLTAGEVGFLPIHVVYSALDEFKDYTMRVPITGGICKVVDNEIIITMSVVS